MRERKYHMEIGGINNLRTALICPDLVLQSLAAGAAAVPAGVVVDLQVAAVLALGDGEAEAAGLTVHYGMSGLFLVREERRQRGKGFPAKLKNLPNGILSHDTHQPVCPEGLWPRLCHWKPDGHRSW